MEGVDVAVVAQTNCWADSSVTYTNPAKFNEDSFWYRNKEMIEGWLAEDSGMDILSQEIPEVK